MTDAQLSPQSRPLNLQASQHHLSPHPKRPQRISSSLQRLPREMPPRLWAQTTGRQPRTTPTWTPGQPTGILFRTWVMTTPSRRRCRSSLASAHPFLGHFGSCLRSSSSFRYSLCDSSPLFEGLFRSVRVSGQWSRLSPPQRRGITCFPGLQCSNRDRWVLQFALVVSAIRRTHIWPTFPSGIGLILNYAGADGLWEPSPRTCGNNAMHTLKHEKCPVKTKHHIRVELMGLSWNSSCLCPRAEYDFRCRHKIMLLTFLARGVLTTPHHRLPRQLWNSRSNKWITPSGSDLHQEERPRYQAGVAFVLVRRARCRPLWRRPSPGNHGHRGKHRDCYLFLQLSR